MGMYDIIEGVTVYCPKCGNVITNTFQTKDLAEPFLEHYKPGDEIPSDREFDDCIEIHSICGNCQLLTGVYVAVGVFNNILTDELV